MSVAARGADLGVAQAVGAVNEHEILATLDVLMSVPAQPRREAALAARVAEWGRAAHPHMAWSVDAFEGESANLWARASGGDAARTLGLAAHLDTSLTGDLERDRAITGADAPPPPHVFDAGAREIRGLGIGIARAPSAAAIVALAAAAGALRAAGTAHRVELLLAAGGTHRAPPPGAPARFGPGVRHALERGWRPDAVLNVKGGPPGVLLEEPCTAYLRVRARSRWTAALVRARVAPAGGLLRHAGVLLDAIEDWRSAYLAAHPPEGQLGSEIAIGALRGGSPDKADLIPGVLEVFVYAVLPPREDPVRVAQELAAFVRPRLAAVPDAPTVDAEAYAWSAGGSAAVAAGDLARVARGAWRAHRGSDPDQVMGWTGATDGAVLLGAGIPTVRFGAYVRRDADDPRIEIVAMDELVACARAWAETVVRYCAA